LERKKKETENPVVVSPAIHAKPALPFGRNVSPSNVDAYVHARVLI
jgi:hypothetical protein